MNKGWVSIHREILDSPLWIQGTYTQKLLMIVLILRANASPKKWLFKGKKILVERGQLITSLESLKNILGKGIGIRQVRTALLNLEKYEFLTNQSTKTVRLITVLNYSKYQGKGKVCDKQRGKEVSKRGQTGDIERSPNNNVNNVNNNKSSAISKSVSIKENKKCLVAEKRSDIQWIQGN